MNRILASLAAICVAVPAIAQDASGDPEAGEKVFRQCKACHMIESADGEEIQKGGQVGPNLWGVAQRQPGSLDGYSYGDDLVAAGAEMGGTWTEEEFVAYVANPRDWLSEKIGGSAKSKMTFMLRKEEDAHDVWAYLVSVGPEAATN